MLKKGLFNPGPNEKMIWKVKMRPVKPIVLQLKVLEEERAFYSRESK